VGCDSGLVALELE